jgi:pimeloyl-ACP methyl ester carboxylesterase
MLEHTSQHSPSPHDDPITCTFPVPVLDGEATIAAWVFPPHHQSDLLPQMWLVCFPTSTYTGLGYFDRQVSGCVPFAYSMARWMSWQGLGLIVVDHLSTDASQVACHGEALTRTVLVEVYRHLIGQQRHRLTHGTFVDGVGHSLGGLLLTQLQGEYASLIALAVLGYANTNETVELAGADLEVGLALAHEVAESHQGYLTPLEARLSLQDFFYSPDAADATIFPIGLAESMLPGIVAEQAARITCPVYLAYGGDRDFTMQPCREPIAYPSAPSITLFVLPGDAHCTNFAARRVDLWQSLAAWVRRTGVEAHGITTLSRMEASPVPPAPSEDQAPHTRTCLMRSTTCI